MTILQAIAGRPDHSMLAFIQEPQDSISNMVPQQPKACSERKKRY
jgi:hypothetical protein